jgi:hypothetical protein
MTQAQDRTTLWCRCHDPESIGQVERDQDGLTGCTGTAPLRLPDAQDPS